MMDGLDGISGISMFVEKQITGKSVTHVCSQLLFLKIKPPKYAVKVLHAHTVKVKAHTSKAVVAAC